MQFSAVKLFKASSSPDDIRLTGGYCDVFLTFRDQCYGAFSFYVLFCALFRNLITSVVGGRKRLSI